MLLVFIPFLNHSIFLWNFCISFQNICFWNVLPLDRGLFLFFFFTSGNFGLCLQFILNTCSQSGKCFYFISVIVTVNPEKFSCGQKLLLCSHRTHLHCISFLAINDEFVALAQMHVHGHSCEVQHLSKLQLNGWWMKAQNLLHAI